VEVRVGFSDDAAERDVSVRESRVEGPGLFAARHFEAGQRIRRMNVVREVTPETPLRLWCG